MKVKWLALVFPLVAILIGAGCGQPKAPPKSGEVPAGYESIRMVGAGIGSKSTTVVMAFATIFNKHYPEIEWSSCSGSSSVNPIYIANGSQQLGMVTPAAYINAFGADKVPTSRLRSINHPTALTHMFFVIPEDKPWKDIGEVPKGLTMYTNRPGTGTYQACELWLQLAGLTKKDFNFISIAEGSETADAWRGGKMDLAFIGCSALEPWLLDMATSPRKFKPMGMAPEMAAKAAAERTFEQIGQTAPAKSNIAEIASEIFKYDVVCPQQPMFLCSRDDFPEGIAYQMAKAIDEYRAELVQVFRVMKFATPQWHMQWARPPCDIHPGVARYYREKGYLK